MYSAILGNKIKLTEDLLTSCFLDLITSHQKTDFLKKILLSARSLSGQTLQLPKFDSFRADLWKPCGAYGEPDAWLMLQSGGETRLSAVTTLGSVLLEVKLGAGKSDWKDDGEQHIPRDQLARYLYASQVQKSPVPCLGLIFLTEHGVCPEEDLKASEHQLREYLPEYAEKLYWLSWCDVTGFLSNEADERSAWGQQCQMLGQILTREGYCRFSGKIPKPPEKNPEQFWNPEKRK